MVGPTTFGYQNLGFGGGGVDLGKLELIDTQTVSSVANVNFESINETIYNVHLLTINNLDFSSDQETLNIRFTNDGGTSYESSSYHYATQRNVRGTGSLAVNSTSASLIELTRLTSNASNEMSNGYVYLYNLGDSSGYSFTTHMLTGLYYNSEAYSNYGAGAYHVAETVNGIRIMDSGGGGTMSATMSLYGVKE
tara:strand:+ start:227 stop:808 length:582 start_codon:yes stop_codon:yes gene_type:complete